MLASPPSHTEAAFETVIESHLLASGYVAVDRNAFDQERGIFPANVLEFIRETQSKEWAKLEALHGAKTGEQVLIDLCKWKMCIRDRGTGECSCLPGAAKTQHMGIEISTRTLVVEAQSTVGDLTGTALRNLDRRESWCARRDRHSGRVVYFHGPAFWYPGQEGRGTALVAVFLKPCVIDAKVRSCA